MVGVFGGTNSVSNREAQYGVKFAHVLIFQEIFALDYNVVAQNIDEGYAVILNIGMCAHTYIDALYCMMHTIAHSFTVATLHLKCVAHCNHLVLICCLLDHTVVHHYSMLIFTHYYCKQSLIPIGQLVC
jgi:hypothetical protein